MKIRLERIRSEPFAWRETLHVDPASLGRQEVVGLSAIECDGTLAPTDAGFVLSLRLSYAMTVACGRCLKAIEVPVSAAVDALVERGGEAAGAAEQELAEPDVGIIRVAGEELETDRLVAEQVQLELPVRPLCRPDCPGLCPGCGADLGEESCRCERKPADPRWAALGELRHRLPDSR